MKQAFFPNILFLLFIVGSISKAAGPVPVDTVKNQARIKELAEQIERNEAEYRSYERRLPGFEDAVKDAARELNNLSAEVERIQKAAGALYEEDGAYISAKKELDMARTRLTKKIEVVRAVQLRGINLEQDRRELQALKNGRPFKREMGGATVAESKVSSGTRMTKPGARFIDERGALRTMASDLGGNTARATDGQIYKVAQYEVESFGGIKAKVNVLDGSNKMQQVAHVFEKGAVADTLGNPFVPKGYEVNGIRNYFRGAHVVGPNNEIRFAQHVFSDGSVIDDKTKTPFKPIAHEVSFEGASRPGVIVLDGSGKVQTIKRIFSDGTVVDQTGKAFKPTAHAIATKVRVKDATGVVREAAYVFGNGTATDAAGGAFKVLGGEAADFAKNFGSTVASRGFFSGLSLSVAGIRRLFNFSRFLTMAKIAAPEAVLWEALYRAGAPGTAEAATTVGQYMSPEGVSKFMALSADKQNEILGLDSGEGGAFEKYKNEYLSKLEKSASFKIDSCKGGNAEFLVTDSQGYKITAKFIKRDDGTTDLVTKNPLNGDIFTVSLSPTSFEQASYNRPKNSLRAKGEKKTFKDPYSMMENLSSQGDIGAFQRANMRMLIAMPMQLQSLSIDCPTFGVITGLFANPPPTNAPAENGAT